MNLCNKCNFDYLIIILGVWNYFMSTFVLNKHNLREAMSRLLLEV